MVINHARSTSTNIPDITVLRPRSPLHETFGHRLEPEAPDYDEVEIEAPLLELKRSHSHSPEPRTTKRKNEILYGCLWILSLLLTSLCTYLLTSTVHGTDSPSLGTYETGFVTDLASARSTIKVSKQHFHGSLDFKDRYGFVPPGSPSEKYFGSGPDVDAAWEELTHDRYFLLSDDEARDAFGPDELDRFWSVHHGGYTVGLDVMHTLHCLNHLRQSLYPRMYPQDPKHSTTHNAHAADISLFSPGGKTKKCIDHLRQLAMCNADLAPVPTQWFDGLSRNYINSSRPHTCRDFSQVRLWADERFNGSTAVKPRNRDGSPRDEALVPYEP